jgi:chromosome segregation ATPase
MHLLNTKSEEISRLEDQLSAEQRKNKDLVQQLSALQQHLTEPTNATPSATKALEQELAEVRAQLALQTASYEIDRAALVLDIETATLGKESAEKDRDFFREQYGMASSFVSSVRDENTELEKQIKIATDQAQSGVSLIKTTFELRIKSLEMDVKSWRRMAEFLVEKDRRTNDDIRRRAADEPELRARCDRLESALECTSDRLLQLEADLEEKQKMLLEEQALGKRWHEMKVMLKLELNEAMTKLERIGKAGISEGDESAHPDGHEFVYRCQWRPDDLSDACEAVFLNISVCNPVLVPLLIIDNLFD